MGPDPCHNPVCVTRQTWRGSEGVTVSFQEVAEPLAGWSRAGLRAGVATLFCVKRSAPRPPGARFAANEKGELVGSVSAGCVEGDLLEHIQQVIAEGRPRVVQYGITDEMAAGVGLSCGGEIDVLVAPYPEDASVWEAVSRVAAGQGAAVLMTLVSKSESAPQLLLHPDGSRVGTLGDTALDEQVAAAAVPFLDTGGTGVLDIEESGAKVFVETFLPPPRLALVGATPIAASLCHLATHLGMSVVVIDPRKAFADPARLPDAADVIQEWPDKAFEQIELDRYWNVVVLAHDQKLDTPALAGALREGCLYVGQIGGKRTQKMRREALSEAGFSESDLKRIHGPVGLDIGSESPQEIALSILAELLAVRRGKMI